ncbi:MAG: cyclophilin-like fold protein [Nitrososphaeria archaeon]
MNRTVSKQRFRITIIGRGEVIASMYRHLSPSTLLRINRVIPFETHIVRQNNMVIMPINVVSGKEKIREEFKKGEIAFSPQESAIVIFLEDSRVTRKYSILGEVETGLELLNVIVHSETVKVERIE